MFAAHIILLQYIIYINKLINFIIFYFKKIIYIYIFFLHLIKKI